LSNQAHQPIDIASYFEGGNGSVEHPYLISTPAHLEYVSLLVNNGKANNFNGKYLKLFNNIRLKNNWIPIGTSANKFQGTFDGNDKTISDIYINSNEDYRGLFGYVIYGNLKNIKVIESYIISLAQLQKESLMI